MEEQIRLEAFNWLRIQSEIYDNVLPRKILESGFEFQGERITLIGASGIWKPRQLKSKPISITTVLNGPYRVLAAYNSQCCLCKLNHIELLDASHIIPDNEPKGDPIVINGLTLCKIHHTAFDVNILGISPDYSIHIREDILHEIDGPMLKHGIQALNNQKIILPARKKDYPDRERLELRFDKFRKVG